MLDYFRRSKTELIKFSRLGLFWVVSLGKVCGKMGPVSFPKTFKGGVNMRLAKEAFIELDFL